MNSTYEIATRLANDLAERYLASDFSDMMISGGAEKAKKVRESSEANDDQSAPLVQNYRAYQRVIYSSLYTLLSGYKGYQIVKIKQDDNHD